MTSDVTAFSKFFSINLHLASVQGTFKIAISVSARIASNLTTSYFRQFSAKFSDPNFVYV